MAKSKAKKMKLKTYDVPDERYLVIVNPWTSHCHPSPPFIENVGGWIERMLSDDWPGTRVDVIYYQGTHKNIIIELPSAVNDIRPYLGTHHYRRFLQENPAAPFRDEVAYLYEYNFELFGHPTHKNWSKSLPTYTTLPPDFPVRSPYPLPGPAPPPPRDVQYAKPIPQDHQFHPDTVALAPVPLDVVENFLATFGPPPKLEPETPGADFIDPRTSPESTSSNVTEGKGVAFVNHQVNEDSSRKGPSLFTPYAPPLHMNRPGYSPAKNTATAGPSRGHGLSTENTVTMGRSADPYVILDRSRDPCLKKLNHGSNQHSNSTSPSVSAKIETLDDRVPPPAPFQFCEPQVKKMDPYEEAEVADALLRSLFSAKPKLEQKRDISEDPYTPPAGLPRALQSPQNLVKSEPDSNSVDTPYTPSDDLLAAFNILQTLSQPLNVSIPESAHSKAYIKEEPSEADALIENSWPLLTQVPEGPTDMRFEHQRSMTLMSDCERFTTRLSDIRVKMEPQDADHLLRSVLKSNYASGGKHSRHGSDDYEPVKKIKTEVGRCDE